MKHRNRIAAGIAFAIAFLLGLTTNVASTLVPEDWTKTHALWVWIAVGILVTIGIASEIAGREAEAPTAPPPHATSVHDTSGTVIIAEAGAQVRFGGQLATAAPAEQDDQIVVGEIPGRPPTFVLRPEIDRLEEIFSSGASVATVSALSGGRGTGKTQIAAEYARRAISSGVDLVGWVAAEDEGRLVAGLAEIAERLGVADPEGDSERSASRLRDTLNERRAPALLVFDNATDPIAIRRRVPSAGTTRVVITSTDLAFGSLGVDIPIDVFAREQAVAYLRRRTGLNDPEGAAAVAETLGDLPLALAQAATTIRLRALTYAEYLEQLEAFPLDRMLPADRGDAYPHGLAEAVLLAIDTIVENDETGATTQILETMAILSVDGVGREVLREASTDQMFEEAVARLVEASLLVWAADHRGVIMHRLVSRTIRDRLEHEGRLEVQLAAVYRMLSPHMVASEDAWASRRSTSEIVDHALTLWGHVVASDDGNSEVVEKLGIVSASWALGHLLAVADFTRTIQEGDRVLAQAARLVEPDDAMLFSARHSVATAYQEVGVLDRAISGFSQLWADSKRAFGPEHRESLASRNNLAAAHMHAQEWKEAIELLKDSVADNERLLGATDPATLTALSNLGAAYAEAGEPEQALPVLRRAFASRVETLGPQHVDTITSCNNLASTLQDLGKLQEAVELMTATVTDAEEGIGVDHPITITSRCNLGCMYAAAGDLDRAVPILKAGVAARQALFGPDHPDVFSAQCNLAAMYADQGDVTAAVALIEPVADRSLTVLGPEHPRTKLAVAALTQLRKAIEGS